MLEERLANRSLIAAFNGFAVIRTDIEGVTERWHALREDLASGRLQVSQPGRV